MAHTRVSACHRSTLLGFLFLFEGSARWIGALGFVPLLTGVAGQLSAVFAVRQRYLQAADSDYVAAPAA